MSCLLLLWSSPTCDILFFEPEEPSESFMHCKSSSCFLDASKLAGCECSKYLAGGIGIDCAYYWWREFVFAVWVWRIVSCSTITSQPFLLPRTPNLTFFLSSNFGLPNMYLSHECLFLVRFLALSCRVYLLLARIIRHNPTGQRALAWRWHRSGP